jgi:predicted GNAT superfamily acetyltransferase
MSDGIAPVKEQEIFIRALHKVEDMRIGVELQNRIWGYSAIDIVPEQLFVVANESGGHVLAAFSEGEPIGFALAFAGIHHERHHLHSHMVGVVPEFQDRGIGRLLKLAQRDDAIARNIDLIEWTFDPLQLKNARFNLSRLGAIVRRYIPNCYGRTSSPLHAGLPTDRLLAEWWVGSARVAKLLENAISSVEPTARISIPSRIREICASDAVQAEEIQTRVRKQFETHLAAGLTTVGFELDDQQGRYLMERYED